MDLNLSVPHGMRSKWATDHPDYPRKQFRRSNWLNLNGEWKFAFDDQKRFKKPDDISEFPLKINVPFAPECELSGINDQGFHPCCWYERTFEFSCQKGGKALLHFGAVDYEARVWVNGRYVGGHEGGHTPFSMDVTEAIAKEGPQTVTVCVYDDPHDLAKPRGKQDWQLRPHSIWYPRTTGIWQAVWLEEVPATYIDYLSWSPHLERWEIGFEAFVTGDEQPQGMQLRVRLSVGERVLAFDTYEVIENEVHRRIALSDPGIDDYRNEILWSPEKPTLIDAEVELVKDGVVIDQIRSYTAIRSIQVQRDRFLLNNRPYYLRLVLDQGYWPESFMTPPSEEAIIHDIQIVKAAGFNGVRKHQKIEDPRFLYWADVLGLLVWEEMPSAYRFTHLSVERLMKEWVEVIDRDLNHPCIITWVPFNESWGVPDLPGKEAHRSCVQAFYHLTKTLDPTRPVVGNDGWESTATDILGIHDYDDNAARILKRYGEGISLPDTLTRDWPGGRMLTLEGHEHEGQPVMLTEFGGIAYRDPKHHENIQTWGYSEGRTALDFQQRYERLLESINRIDAFSGFCYTQFTDTFQEANGLFFADRTPKFPVEAMYAATRGRGLGRPELTTPPVPPPKVPEKIAERFTQKMKQAEPQNNLDV